MFAFDAPTLDCRNCCRKRAMAICTGDCHRTFLMEFLTYCCWQSCRTCTSRCGWPRPMPSHGICRLQFVDVNLQVQQIILQSSPSIIHHAPWWSFPVAPLAARDGPFLSGNEQMKRDQNLWYCSMIVVKKHERLPDWLMTNRFVITFIAKYPLNISGHASSLLVMHSEAFVSGAPLFYKVLGKQGIMF